MTQDRDAKAAQLAPFLALANQRFESAPPDKRLDLLLDRVEQLTETVRETASKIGKRRLDRDSINHIRTKLDFAPRVVVHIDGMLGDADSLSLGEQIKEVFEGSGFTVEGVNQVVWSKPIEGVIVRASRVPEGDLAAGLLQLFSELRIKPVVTIKDDMSDSEIAILVGSR